MIHTPSPEGMEVIKESTGAAKSNLESLSARL